MDIHNIVMISIPALSVLLLFHLLNRHKKQNKQSLKLPPGSMGWPYIGETYQLYSQDPNLFFASKQKRYGEIFKTHILGCPCIMLASPEASRFVLVSQAHLFKPTYPASKEKLIGPSAIFFHQGDYHALLRKHVQAALSLGTVRRRVADIETIAVSTLNAWSHGKPINTFLEMKKFSFNVGIHSILGYLDEKCKEELKKNYSIVDKGYNSFPTSMPGAAYQKAIVARKRLDEIIRDIICKRKAKRSEENDLLSHLLNYKDAKGETLSDVQIADNFVGVLFAAQDTMASALTWILKYLHDDQKLLEAVKAEQQAISEENEGGKRPLTWAQTRNMPLTCRVIMESLRMASIISFTFREAVADVEYKGYIIPKGWKVMPLFRNIHYNPEFFKDPQVFDPSRFEVAPKPNTFMPFGNGVHACPGNELAKMEMLVFVHHLLTKFRWEVVESKAGIQYRPFPIPFNGLPARFWKGSA